MTMELYDRRVASDQAFGLAYALRSLELYLRQTPHHNAPEAAAARKALSAFDEAVLAAQPSASEPL